MGKIKVVFEKIMNCISIVIDKIEFDDSGENEYQSTKHIDKFNPSTGLPMIGLLDTDGNPWGCSGSNSLRNTSINPATGLPMLGVVDIAGNPYGSGSSSSSCSDSIIDYSDNGTNHSISSGYEYTSYSSSSSDDY